MRYIVFLRTAAMCLFIFQC